MNRFLFSLFTLTALSFALAAEEKPKAAPAPAAPAKAEAKPGAKVESLPPQPSAEQVLNELLRRRAENPLIEPVRSGNNPANNVPNTPAGVPLAPGSGKPTTGAASRAAHPASPTTLRREGQFIVTRRARIVRASADSAAWVVTFESDSSTLQEPPMYLMPCQMLEDMENVISQHGDAAVFVVSGQIYAYRSANYLMPTLFKLAPAKDNLQP